MHYVYLDNAATTHVCPEAAEIIRKYTNKEYGNASSLHTLGQKAKESLEASRASIAKTINAAPEELIFTSGETESNNLAILGASRANAANGRHIITTKIEHPSVLNAFAALEKEGFEITHLGVNSEGLIDLAELEKNLRKDTILVSILHASNEIGTIEPVTQAGELIKSKSNALFHVDCAQSYGKIPVNVEELKADLVTINSHKIHGPKGVGALYIRKGAKIAPLMFGGAQEKKLRPGTENVAGIAGFAKAAEVAHATMKKDAKNIARLRNMLVEGIEKTIPHTILNGHQGNSRLPDNVNISFGNIEGESIIILLDSKGVGAST
ncbi:MAG: cysteine desulfurase, partial [Candidatus Aenigmarchaeota archaeon]|nr:cysteine desulfurase [Candidatus Aenigmarchaeota archaeon]